MVCYGSSLRTVFIVVFLRFVVTLVFCALFWTSCIWLFGTLFPCAVFGMCFVGFVVMLLFCALFCLCFVWLFGTLVPYALFWMCSVRFVVTLVYCALLFDFLLGKYFAHCFEYVVFGFFFTLAASTLFCMCTVWSYVTSVACALFCMCSVLFFGTLLPCALLCSGRLLVTLVFCAPFWMCSVWLFGTVVPRFRTFLNGFCRTFFYVSVLYSVLKVLCLMVCHVSSLHSAF